MLGCVEKVRRGEMRTNVFQKAECSSRALNINLSRLSVVEPVFKSSVLSVSLDPSARYLLTGTSNGQWFIHDTFNLSGNSEHTKRCVESSAQSFHSSGINTVEWYPIDGEMFTTSSADGYLCLWNAENTDGAVERYDFKNRISRHQTNPVTGSSIAVGFELQVCSGRNVNILDIRAGTPIQKLPETGTSSIEVQWSPRHEHILTVGGDDGHLIEWDIRSTLMYRAFGLEEIKVARRSVRTRDFFESRKFLSQVHRGPVKCIRYSRDGLGLFSAGQDGRMRRFTLELGSDINVATTYFGKLKTNLGNCTFDLCSETNPLLAFVPHGHSVLLCDMDSCTVVKKLRGHFKQVNCFLYDSVNLNGYSGGNDFAVMVWNGNDHSEQAYQQEKSVSTTQESNLIDLGDIDD